MVERSLTSSVSGSVFRRAHAFARPCLLSTLAHQLMKKYFPATHRLADDIQIYQVLKPNCGAAEPLVGLEIDGCV